MLVTACTLSACDPLLGPDSPDRNWAVASRGRFEFYTRPGSFAEQSVDVMGEALNDQYEYTVRLLQHRYAGTVRVFLHESGADAGFGADLGGGDFTGVAYPETESVKTVVRPPLDGNRFSLLQHESNHVILNNGLGRPGTSFMNEGMASAVISGRFHAFGPEFYHQWVAANRVRLPRLADLVRDDRWDATEQAIAYRASASFLAFLIERFGGDPIRELFGVTSANFPRVFRETVGLDLDEAERQWLAFVNTSATPSARAAPRHDRD